MRVVKSIILVWLLLAVVARGQVPVGTRFPLVKATHVYGTLAKWETLYAAIYDSSGEVVTTRTMNSVGTGIWVGYYQTSVVGSFVAQYRAVIGSDTVAEEELFVVSDTLEKKIDHRVGTPTDPAHTGTTLFAGQQYIQDNLGGGGGGSSGCGTGAFACTVSVRDSSLYSGIDKVTVLVRNSAQTSTVIPGSTNANGNVIFNLDSLGTGETYYVWLRQLGYNFVFSETINVRGSDSWTFYGTPFVWTASPPDSQTAVVGQVFDLELDSLSGVEIKARAYLPNGGTMYYHGEGSLFYSHMFFYFHIFYNMFYVT